MTDMTDTRTDFLLPRHRVVETRWGKKVLAAAVLGLLVSLSSQWSSGQEAQADKSGRLYGRAKQASVEILVDDHLDGSGWFADKSGLVLTAAHVIGEPGHRIEVLSPVAGRIEADVVAVDQGADLALLRAKPRKGGYPALSLADAVPPAGRDVFLFGMSIFRHGVLLRGAVARKDTTFEYYGERGLYVEIVHIGATVQRGTSGSPWLNAGGEVVGLQSGVMSEKGVPVGIAFMVPASAIRRLLAGEHTAETATLGVAVEETWQQQRDFLKRFPPRTEGLVARIVRSDGPAARAGLKQWDVITAVDGNKVRLPDQLLRFIRAKKPGQSVALTVLGPDGTGIRQLSVRLGKLETAWSEPRGSKQESWGQSAVSR